jgi:hypothetical protein
MYLIQEMPLFLSNIFEIYMFDMWLCAISIWLWEQGILVHLATAQRLAGRNYYMVEDANHMEVCKPTSKEHSSYALLLDFIKEVSLNNHASFMFHCD